MRKNLRITCIMLLLLTSCKSRDNLVVNKEQQSYPASLLNLSTLLIEEENDVSFPIWFNDSMIKAHGINKITRKSFPKNDFDGDEESSSVSSIVPREIREYYFDNKGFISQLNVHNYYDDREIGSVLFSYSGERDGYGFSKVKQNTFVSKTTKPFSENEESLDPDTRELDFRMHEKRKTYNRCLVYQDMETGDFLFNILNKKSFGSLSIDSMLSPTPKDHLVWGEPCRPIKKYQVSNKVNESNVRIISYYKMHPNVINYWVKKDYPFEHKRDFTYTKKGVCVGYIDSTFSDEKYITRIVSEIQYNKNEEPTRIIHRKENSTKELQFFTLEIFEYERNQQRKAAPKVSAK